jgi:hypothetical protein
MPTPVKKIQTPDELLNRVQDASLPALNALLSIPVLDGRLTEEITLSGTAVPLPFPHKLGRLPLGWIPVSVKGGTGIYEDNIPRDEKFIWLRSSVALTCQLWVF